VATINENTMNQPTEKKFPEQDNPKFGKLLIVLLIAVLFVVFLTWLMENYFPNFGA
jgi:flagellar biogenesis protein FliO